MSYPLASIEPRDEQLRALLEFDGEDGPITMLNLLRYAERADYPSDFEAEPCSGREAYARYGKVAFKTLSGVGGRILWIGQVALSLIAPQDEQWDDVVLVQYPSRAAFLGMLQLEEYKAAAPHRTAALADSRLIASHQGMSALGE